MSEKEIGLPLKVGLALATPLIWLRMWQRRRTVKKFRAKSLSFFSGVTDEELEDMLYGDVLTMESARKKYIRKYGK